MSDISTPSVGLVAVGSLAFGGWLAHRYGAVASWTSLAARLVGGGAAMLALRAALDALFQFTGVSAGGTPMLALFAAVAIVGPAEHALAVWPAAAHAQASPHLPRRALVTASAAFGGGQAVALIGAAMLANAPAAELWLTLLAGAALTVGVAVWTALLAAPLATTRRWFPAAWLTLALIHGASRWAAARGVGPGFSVVVGELLLAASLAYVQLRTTRVSAPASLGPTSPRLTLLGVGSLAGARQLLGMDRPLMPGWIAFGALVQLGALTLQVAVAVYLGRVFSIDYGADRGGAQWQAVMVLALLLAAAFPMTGFLVARASKTQSLLEPGLASALGSLLVLTLVSLSTTVPIVVWLAGPPTALVLSSFGAWFGVSR